MSDSRTLELILKASDQATKVVDSAGTKIEAKLRNLQSKMSNMTGSQKAGAATKPRRALPPIFTPSHHIGALTVSVPTASEPAGIVTVAVPELRGVVEEE